MQSIDLTTPAAALAYLSSIDEETMELSGAHEAPSTIDDAVQAITGESANRFGEMHRRWVWSKEELLAALIPLVAPSGVIGTTLPASPEGVACVPAATQTKTFTKSEWLAMPLVLPADSRNGNVRQSADGVLWMWVSSGKRVTVQKVTMDDFMPAGSHCMFQRHYGYEKASVRKWEYSDTFAKWGAYVTFDDGHQCFTWPQITTPTVDPDLSTEDHANLEEIEEYAKLQALCDEAEGYSSDWKYGATLIRNSHFQSYAQDFAEDIGAIDRNAEWPLGCIDWEKAADELKSDYTAVEFDGVTYWVR